MVSYLVSSRGAALLLPSIALRAASSAHISMFQDVSKSPRIEPAPKMQSVTSSTRSEHDVRVELGKREKEIALLKRQVEELEEMVECLTRTADREPLARRRPRGGGGGAK